MSRSAVTSSLIQKHIICSDFFLISEKCYSLTGITVCLYQLGDELSGTNLAYLSMMCSVFNIFEETG